MQVEVDRIDILLKNLTVHNIDSSLLQWHVHNSAQNLEQVLQHVLFRVLIKLLNIAAKGYIEFTSLHSHVVS